MHCDAQLHSFIYICISLCYIFIYSMKLYILIYNIGCMHSIDVQAIDSQNKTYTSLYKAAQDACIAQMHRLIEQNIYKVMYSCIGCIAQMHRLIEQNLYKFIYICIGCMLSIDVQTNSTKYIQVCIHLRWMHAQHRCIDSKKKI